MSDDVVDVELTATDPYRFRPSVQIHMLGPLDPTVRVTPTSLAKALATPEGPLTLYARWSADDRRIAVTLHGPGARWLEPRLASFFGLDDPPDAFRPDVAWPDDAKVKALYQRGRGLRLARAPSLFERHAGYILQQRVTFGEAAEVWNRMHRARGALAPEVMAGDVVVPDHPRLVVPLTASEWRRVASADLQRLGVDNKRWVALQEAARVAARVEALADDRPALRRLMMAIPGTGVWTTECVLGFAAGDPDALVLGDVHLPHVVSQHFDGDPRGDDAHMQRLLEPYRPHRFRIIRWLMAPRYGAG